MTFSISALVSARDSHIKPDSEAGGLIPGTICKILCHNLFISYFTLTFFKHWFYIAEKIFELTNCENKSLRELPLFNLQIFLQCCSVQWRYNVFVKSTQDADIWMELRANNQHWLLAIIGHAKTNILQQNMW